MSYKPLLLITVFFPIALAPSLWWQPQTNNAHFLCIHSGTLQDWDTLVLMSEKGYDRKSWKHLYWCFAMTFYGYIHDCHILAALLSNLWLYENQTYRLSCVHMVHLCEKLYHDRSYWGIYIHTHIFGILYLYGIATVDRWQEIRRVWDGEWHATEIWGRCGSCLAP